AEVKRYELAVGTELATENSIVLDYLIDQLLLSQAAAAAFTVDEAVLGEHLEALNLSEEALNAWKAAYQYSETEFEQALSTAIAAAWMRDQILAEVPTTAEQVHARQILVYTLEEAEKVYADLESGTSFETLASQYAPITLGDLGWFPRDYLTVPELDDIIFNLAPNEYSTIIETRLGYHIVQVLEHDQKAKLSPAAQRLIESQTVTAWLNQQRAISEITIFEQ
ncbi:MAG: peptidylprolyl isomerase, partial [Chloroflexota bacterium]